jgi:hypothetical protein
MAQPLKVLGNYGFFAACSVDRKKLKDDHYKVMDGKDTVALDALKAIDKYEEEKVLGKVNDDFNFTEEFFDRVNVELEKETKRLNDLREPDPKTKDIDYFSNVEGYSVRDIIHATNRFNHYRENCHLIGLDKDAFDYIRNICRYHLDDFEDIKLRIDRAIFLIRKKDEYEKMKVTSVSVGATNDGNKNATVLTKIDGELPSFLSDKKPKVSKLAKEKIQLFFKDLNLNVDSYKANHQFAKSDIQLFIDEVARINFEKMTYKDRFNVFQKGLQVIATLYHDINIKEEDLLFSLKVFETLVKWRRSYKRDPFQDGIIGGPVLYQFIKKFNLGDELELKLKKKEKYLAVINERRFFNFLVEKYPKFFIKFSDVLGHLNFKIENDINKARKKLIEKLNSYDGNKVILFYTDHIIDYSELTRIKIPFQLRYFSAYDEEGSNPRDFKLVNWKKDTRVYRRLNASDGFLELKVLQEFQFVYIKFKNAMNKMVQLDSFQMDKISDIDLKSIVASLPDSPYYVPLSPSF